MGCPEREMRFFPNAIMDLGARNFTGGAGGLGGAVVKIGAHGEQGKGFNH